jgi:predicted nucleotidyltransferase
VISVLRQELPELRSRYGVKRIGLFGSYARDKAADDSDVDIVVEFERPIGLKFVAFADHLETLLGRGVDILTPAGVRTIRLERVARAIAESIVYV